MQAIDMQIKAYDEKEKSAKKSDIEAHFAESIGDLKGIIKLENMWDPTWLNTNVSVNKVFEMIDAKIQHANADITIIRDMGTMECVADMLDAYFKTLDLSAAMSVQKQWQEKQKKAQQLQEIEDRRKAAEEIERLNEERRMSMYEEPKTDPVVADIEMYVSTQKFNERVDNFDPRATAETTMDPVSGYVPDT